MYRRSLSVFLHFSDSLEAVSVRLPWIPHVRVRHTLLCNNLIDGIFLGNTNGSRYEVFALLGEVYGSGLPFGYVLIRLDHAASGAKGRCINALLKHLRSVWKIRALTTLTDKDWSEINAFLAAYPEAKHQLCFWHCLRAVKKRLSILRRAPAHYNVAEAMKEFNFIHGDFVPIGQRSGCVSEMI